tara:strand:+ start:929 stop:1207 length:279 start_codon:yes stop_codon:yes gene_type:complete
MELLFLKILFVSAAISWAYVDKLTANYGLLDCLPQYYPKKLEGLLNCAFCLSGWLSLAGVLVFYKSFGNYFILAALVAPFCGMAAVKILFYR